MEKKNKVYITVIHNIIVRKNISILKKKWGNFFKRLQTIFFTIITIIISIILKSVVKDIKKIIIIKIILNFIFICLEILAIHYYIIESFSKAVCTKLQENFSQILRNLTVIMLVIRLFNIVILSNASSNSSSFSEMALFISLFSFLNYSISFISSVSRYNKFIYSVYNSYG